ncbi:MAG: HAMP domain-containing sensor histidine kinase, partial [Acidobacteriota bacterium]
GDETATDLVALTRSVAYVLGAEARRRGITIQTALPAADAVAPVRGTVGSWQTIVFNLLLNAVAHTPTGAAVDVRVAPRADGGARFETRNPGIIDPAVRSSLFDPFVGARADGTGLGLALVAGRVAELGGAIAAEADDGDVLFRVDAPAASSASSASPTSSPSSTSTASTEVRA